MASSSRHKRSDVRERKEKCRVLDEHESMVLAGADRDAFLDAVLNPPRPTAKLIAALKRHRDLKL